MIQNYLEQNQLNKNFQVQNFQESQQYNHKAASKILDFSRNENFYGDESGNNIIGQEKESPSPVQTSSHKIALQQMEHALQKQLLKIQLVIPQSAQIINQTMTLTDLIFQQQTKYVQESNDQQEVKMQSIEDLYSNYIANNNLFEKLCYENDQDQKYSQDNFTI